MSDPSEEENSMDKSAAGNAGPASDVEKLPTEQDTMPPLKSNIGERPEMFKTTIQEVFFVFVATMAVGVTSFVIGAVTVLSTFVGRDLSMTTAEISWINAASGLASGSFLLFFGRFADLFGRKSMLLCSLASFTVLCLGTGFSQNGITVDVLSGLMGLASAAAVPPALGILGLAYKPSKRKNYAFACFGAGNPLGFVFGGVLGGIATQLASWRASFWSLAVIYLIVTVTAIFAVPRDTEQKKKISTTTLKEFDILGALLTVSGIALFSTALTQGSEAPQGWKTPYVIVLLILGVVLIAAFVFWEHRFSHPLVPPSIFKDRNFSLLLLILISGFLAFSPSLFWISLYMQYVMKLRPLEVAVHLLPAAIMGTVYNLIAGALLHKVSNKLLMAMGSVAYTISFILMAIQRDGDSYWAFLFPALALTVMGADFQFNVCNMYVMSSRPPAEQSVAGGILQTATKLASTVGFGIATAIYDSVKNKPPQTGFYGGNAAAPYAAVFWYCTAISVVGLLLVPFLTIGTQGNQAPASAEVSTPVDDSANGEQWSTEEKATHGKVSTATDE